MELVPAARRAQGSDAWAKMKTGTSQLFSELFAQKPLLQLLNPTSFVERKVFRWCRGWLPPDVLLNVRRVNEG